MKQLYLVSVRRFQTGERAVQATTGSPSASADETDDASAEKKPLLSGKPLFETVRWECHNSVLSKHPWVLGVYKPKSGVGTCTGKLSVRITYIHTNLRIISYRGWAFTWGWVFIQDRTVQVHTNYAKIKLTT